MAQSIFEFTEELAALEQTFDMEEFVATLADMQRLADIGKLTAGIAQELANLLSTVSTASISLRHELQHHEPPDDVVQHYMTLIERNALRAGQIVEMLQGYGTVDSQEMAVTDIDAILRDMMMLVERQFREESNIHIQVKTAGEMPALVCDHKGIVQLLVNLLLNARDSIQETGGVIEVEVHPAYNGHAGNLSGFTGRSKEDSECIAISIADDRPSNGQETHFPPVVPTRSNGSGAGLGLSMAQEIVRQHQGDIFFSNRRGPGSGASVTVILPVRPSR